MLDVLWLLFLDAWIDFAICDFWVSSWCQSPLDSDGGLPPSSPFRHLNEDNDFINYDDSNVMRMKYLGENVGSQILGEAYPKDLNSNGKDICQIWFAICGK